MKINYYNIKKVNDIINQVKDKKIFLCPAGKNSAEIIAKCKNKDKIKGFIDNNGVEIDGYSTYSSSDMKKFNNSVVIITSEKFHKELYSELIENGFDGKIIECTNEFPIVNKIEYEKENFIRINRMDLVLSSRCTLRCKKCANLMQYYEKQHDVDINIIYKSISNLIDSIDEIGTINVIGGEPLLYKKLSEVIRILKNKNKINFINIITNGTILPQNDDLWKEMSNPKIVLSISDYGKLSKNKIKLLEKCEQYGVNVEILETKVFYDTGNLECRNRTAEELHIVFKECATQCRSLFDGELHYCPRSAHGTDLKFIEKKNLDYVNVLDKHDLRKKIYNLINKNDYIEACNYCDIRRPGYYEKEYPVAEQV
jgi:organic radical activating enzyme